MRSNYFESILKIAGLAVTLLFIGSGLSLAQSVGLTATPQTIVLPGGNSVPMWGLVCGTSTAAGAPAASAAPTGGVTCTTASPNAGANWSPVIITTAPGTLTINLANGLSFLTPLKATNNVPTSLVIVGQLGGGLGDTPNRTPSPNHAQQVATWPIAGSNPPATGDPVFNPPHQLDRVQSFGTEVLAGGTAALTWPSLKPGTYLIESGTHPSIQGPMGLYGVLVVTTPPASGATGTAYPAAGSTAAVNYSADIPLVLSEIDPVQNASVAAAVLTDGFSETTVWSGQPGGCGNPSSAKFNTCYPPAVNYDPRYYLINGVALDKSNPARSSFSTNPSPATGSVLVRFVNAGLRMHIPSIVGAQTNDDSSGTLKVVNGFSLIAEDGNVLPGNFRVQSEVFLAAGKTYDLMMNAPVGVGGAAPPVLPVFDRQLSLSTNNQRDGGMQAFISANTASVLPVSATTVALSPDSFFCTAGVPLVVSDPGKGVIANDIGVYGVALSGTPTGGTVALSSDGTFTYTPSSATACTGSFFYYANGNTLVTAKVSINTCTSSGGCLGSAPTAQPDFYTSNISSRLQIPPPGVLANDSDPQGHPLTAHIVGAASGGTVTLNADGSFSATPATTPTGSATAVVTFHYQAENSQNTFSSPTAGALVTVTFNGGSGLAVVVKDAPTGLPIPDYRWIIEEDRTFQINPATQVQNGATNVPSLGTSFHTSYMPVVASGCAGPTGAVACESGQTVFDPTTQSHLPTVCDVGNGVCRTDAPQQVAVDPGQVRLDPTKRYYISILPGDAGNSFSSGAGAPQPQDPTNPSGAQRQSTIAQDCGTYASSGSTAANWTPGTGTCGHTMGGAPIAPGQTSVSVMLQETPLATAKVSVFVFEDDFPLNGEHDAGGGIDVIATNEPGLSGFEITLFDDAGGTGDATGQMTYDMFNMPLSNSLAGTIDPATGLDACPISKSTDGLVGMIVTCPTFESDGATMSSLAGQAIIANMMPGRYGVVATPGADRIARGEEWLQTNTLDGQKAHDSFIKVGGPSYFQEFGPAGFHVVIGFANPAIINARKPAGGTNTVTGTITDMRVSRSPDQRLFSSGSHDALGFTQCYVTMGDPDGEDFAFTKCNADGTFSLSGIPNGDWRITVFDQWNDQIVDGLSTPVRLTGSGFNMGDIPQQQWHTNLATRTFFDVNGDGVSNMDSQGNTTEPGLSLVPTNVRFRDGSYSNFNNTDLNGFAGFNEIFPLFNWYVVEADTTRYKQTGVHVVYDAGGPADCTTPQGITPAPPCSNIAANLAGTRESATAHLPVNLRVPGAVYCDNADCQGFSIVNGPSTSASNPSTGRIDPPWVTTEGWQGFLGQYSFIEFGKKPYAVGETGGIHGEVIYASTRPFDDPALLIHTSWTPDVPGVTINLYQETTATDGTQTLKLVDTTKTSSWDDWAQGFRSGGVPNMNCPGQETAGNGSLFFYTLRNSRQWLNPTTPLPNNSQFKCYDGMLMFNQVQPAPYDGMYQFPSIIGRNATTGAPTGQGSLNGTRAPLPGSNCLICIANPTDSTPMLPAGKYVVEMIVPPGYELVKEEDKNILIGDNYIAPVTQQFGGLGSIFILPDQAAVKNTYNANNPQNPTQDLGATPRHEGDTGSVETFWPCVGALRIVPDYISLFPQSGEVAPFAGASRHLCDRKEVTLEDQSAALAKFWVFSSTHVAAHFTGIITDDFASEFDPFSPQFGEKFAVPNLPISFKDFTGNEVSRTYSDQWGFFNGLNYSTWEVNPPNPTGYAPTMMVTCMNDPGPVHTNPLDLTSPLVTDPLYNPNYSQFCYEIPFMPGQTQYMDTPVVPTSAFAEGYNPPDCAYPDATPAVSTVTGDASGGGAGPWVSAVGHTLTINAFGVTLTTAGTMANTGVQVPNYAYSGPSATGAPFNQKFLTRHYGFGATQGTGSVTIAGVNAPVTSWSDTQIQVTVPELGAASTCTIQQAGVSAPTECGQLIVTSGNGKHSVDAVTVTIGGKVPRYINGESPSNDAIQSAIDAATPGDLIIVGPGTYYELVLMWKPVRLQGVGASSVTINANTHPSGKLDAWRKRVNCLFGLALNGQPYSTPGNQVPLPGGGGFEPLNVYDPSGMTTCGGWTGFTGGPNNPQVDRLPLEGVVGWDTTVNGNLAEQLLEPSLMGAYEGAGITVLAKGVRYPAGLNVFGTGADNATGSFIAHESQMPVPTIELTNSVADCNDYPSNFQCNPSRIDGIGITNSSQGGGGIFVHAWGHNLEISNDRIFSNAGTLSGGINVGQGEAPDALLSGNGGDPVGYNGGTLAGFDQQPWTCLPGAVIATNTTPYGYDQVVSPPGTVTGQQLPYCYNLNVRVHHNAISSNASYGDELFSSTPAGAGGVTFSTGADYYHFNNNWVCGNLSSGDGGGVMQLGFMYNGDISHNQILFNQSTNPTIPTHGGGIAVLGAAPDGPGPVGSGVVECGSVTDVDCAPGLSDGTGPGLVIDGNLVLGNTAESGSGGGIRLQIVNGTEIGRFPNTPDQWYGVSVINNIIANNVAGWDGGGVSIQDALKVNFINNTVASNDTTASAGVLFNAIGAPLTSAGAPTCTPSAGNAVCTSPQPAGFVTSQHTANLSGSLPAGGITCPTGHLNCATISYPVLENNLFWQNRYFNIAVGGLGTGLLSQQNLVTLVPALSQTTTGQCVNGATYWDIGIRGDTGPTNHNSGLSLSPTNSILTSLSGSYTGNGNLAPSTMPVIAQYCNGSRVPPEGGGRGYLVPPGISDATMPNPVFNLTAAATVDEGNNWVNMTYGPLALSNLSSTNPTSTPLGNYSIGATSPALNVGSATGAPNHDFFGNPRPQGTGFDIGAVEFAGAAAAPVASVTGGPLNLGNVGVSSPASTSAPQSLALHNTGNASLTGITLAFSAGFSRATGLAAGTCGTTLAAAGTCTINVVFSPTALGAVAGTLTITANVTVTGSPVGLSGSGVAPVVGATLTPTSRNFGTAARGVTARGAPAQVFRLTNTGNVTLTGITQGTISGTDSGDFPVARIASTCGPAGGGQFVGQTTLAPGASCAVTVQFRPPTTDTAGAKGPATLSVTDAAGTQTATPLTGTAQ
jgi:hypothetical protein